MSSSVLPFQIMFGKILLTLAVIFGAYLVLRTRFRSARRSPVPRLVTQAPLIPGVSIRAMAYGLVVAMGAGSLGWLYLDWRESQTVVSVQVINANTGSIVRYEARRSQIEGRRLTTLDGRRVILAEVERMVLE